MIKVIFIGLVTLTSYRPIPSQTDSSPFITSIGTRVNEHGVAVSRDLLCPAALFKDLRIKRHSSAVCKIKKVHYGDVLNVEGFGFKKVDDCMNERHKNRIDILVMSKAQEKKIGVQHNIGVTLIRRYN